MFRIYFLPVFFIIGIMGSYSQTNLIPNPDFEKCDLCDFQGLKELGIGQGANTPPDWNAATFGTSDFRSTFPRSGKRHGGFFVGFAKHEYLTNHLTEALEDGSVYRFSFYTVPDARNPTFAIDELGVYFQKGAANFPQATPLRQLNPQFLTPDNQYLQDTKYQKVEFNYESCGGEDHFIVGRFNSLGSGDTLFIGRDHPKDVQTVGIYYNVDDFEMIELSRINKDVLIDSIIICNTDPVVLSLPENQDYKQIEWSTGETGKQIQFSGEGRVSVKAVLNNRCNTTIFDSTYIRREEPTSVQVDDLISGPPKACEDKPEKYSINFSLISIPKNRIEKIEWNNGASTEDIIVHNADSVSVKLWVKDSCLIFYGTKKIGKYLSGLKIKASKNQACKQESIVLELLKNGDAFAKDFIWNTGEIGERITVTGPGTYSVSTESVCGEQKNAQIQIDVSDRTTDGILQLPNVIFPLQAKNNQFGIVLPTEIEKVSRLELNVFNRWGKKVFHTKDKNSYWRPDATFPVETYYYYMEYIYEGCKGKVKGNLQIIK